MSDWLGGIFETISSFFTGETVQAIATAAVKGAVTGVVIGAASAAIRGDDILEGALKGAAYGGVVGGIVGTIGSLSGVDEYTKDVQNKTMGAPEGAESIVEGNAGVTSGVNKNQWAPKVDSKPVSQLTSNSPVTPDPSASKTSGITDYLKSDSGAKILAGVGQGLAAGAGSYLSAEKKAETDMDIENKRLQAEKDKIAANQPGNILQAQTANIEIQSWWDRHLNKNTGLLNQNQGVA